MAATRKKLTPGKNVPAGGPKKKITSGAAKAAKAVKSQKRTGAADGASAKKSGKTSLSKASASSKTPAKKIAAKRTPAKKPPVKTAKAALTRKLPAKKAATAKSRATPVKTVTVSSEPGALEVAHKAAAILFAKKAEDVVLLDLRALSTVADYYLICTCQNEPQMRAILSSVQRTLSREGIKSLRSEYMPGVRWAVMDYADLIIHLFEKQTRGFYSLERLWADAPSLELKASDYALPEDVEADGDDDEL